MLVRGKGYMKELHVHSQGKCVAFVIEEKEECKGQKGPVKAKKIGAQKRKGKRRSAHGENGRKVIGKSWV